MSDLDLDPGETDRDPGETDRVPKRYRIAEAVAAVAPDAAAGPVMKRTVVASSVGAKTVPCACQFCAKIISCSTQVNGTIGKGNLRAHEKHCLKNPDRVVVSIRGKMVSAVFGLLGSDAEFQAPEAVRVLTQGSAKALVGAIHKFPDGSEHPVVRKQTGEPPRILDFFHGKRCCFTEDKSMMQFRLRPDLFPKLYDAEGRCFIAEIGTNIIVGAPETSKPWTTSQLRLISPNFHGTVEVFDIRCCKIIKMNVGNCSQGQGPCRICAFNEVPY
jgi:hypothetical protein